MGQTTIGFGIALVAIGLIGYLGFGRTSVTALIPAFFGIVLVALGALALKERLRKHAMHAAALVGVVGLVGAVMRLVAPAPGNPDAPFALTPAKTMILLMAVTCLGFVILCVKSFVDARRNRQAE